jgi:hypothetical protein
MKVNDQIVSGMMIVQLGFLFIVHSEWIVVSATNETMETLGKSIG